MKKVKKFSLIAGIIIVLVILASLIIFNLKKNKSEESGQGSISYQTVNIEFGEDKVAKITTLDGEEKVIEAKTIENIDTQVKLDCPSESCGVGAYIYVPTETYEDFENYTLGKCIDTDGWYGSQCWDLGDAFWQNYAGRNLSTCGTGEARGIWNCKEQNAGDEFELITDKHNIQAGDWIIFNSGQYGHVGMALGHYNNGYVTLLGQNQGGEWCPNGGSSTNIVNINLSSFLGAFRPKSYIVTPEPVEPDDPDLPFSGCLYWDVVWGDTMSAIMLNCENTVVYGQAMNDYAKTWFSTKVKPNQSVYDGWQSETGVGLYDGDTIEHKVK